MAVIQLNFTTLQIGDEITALVKPPITRTTLALFAGASGDHNPIHIDIDFAKAAGMPDVIAHGMLPMAYLGQLLTGWVPQSAIRTFEVDFLATTQVGDAITCKGRIVSKFEEASEQRVRLAIEAIDQNGECKLRGEAVVAITQSKDRKR